MKDWRSTAEYRAWRAQVIRRDGRCKVCGSNKDREAHHIMHASYYPELRFAENNGVCMCAKCHKNFHNNFMPSNRIMCSDYEFNNFIELSKYFYGDGCRKDTEGGTI